MSVEWVMLGISKLVCWLILGSTSVCMIDYTRKDVFSVR